MQKTKNQEQKQAKPTPKPKSKQKPKGHGAKLEGRPDTRCPIILVLPTSTCASAARRRDAGCCRPGSVLRRSRFLRAPDHLKIRNGCPGPATAVRSRRHPGSARDRARQNDRDR